MDSEFRQALRAAQSTNSDLDYQGAIVVGQRAGYTPLQLAQMGIPVKFFAQELAILESPTDDGQLSGEELATLGLDASTMPGGRRYSTDWYVNVKRVRLPLYEEYLARPGVDRWGWREASKEYILLPNGRVLLEKEDYRTILDGRTKRVLQFSCWVS